MGAYFLKKQARSPILEGFGRNIYALLSFSGQQYLKYFIEAMRMVYLKGSGLVDLLPEIGILSLFAVFFNSWAVISYRKSR